MAARAKTDDLVPAAKLYPTGAPEKMMAVEGEPGADADAPTLAESEQPTLGGDGYR